MGDQFTLEAPPVPATVRVTNARGLLSARVHYSDNMERTLCGQGHKYGPLVHAPGVGATCARCAQAVDGWARFRRLIR